MSICFAEAGLRSPLPLLPGEAVELFRELLKLAVSAVGEAVAAVVVVAGDADPVVGAEDLSRNKGEEVEPRPSK